MSTSVRTSAITRLRRSWMWTPTVTWICLLATLTARFGTGRTTVVPSWSTQITGTRSTVMMSETTPTQRSWTLMGTTNWICLWGTNKARLSTWRILVVTEKAGPTHSFRRLQMSERSDLTPLRHSWTWTRTVTWTRLWGTPLATSSTGRTSVAHSRHRREQQTRSTVPTSLKRSKLVPATVQIPLGPHPTAVYKVFKRVKHHSG